MKTIYQNSFRNAWVALLFGAMLCTSCDEEEPKSAACEILSFSVNGEDWTINGTGIAHAYPAETEATAFTPAITLSPGATVNPPANRSQDFFAEAGVAYTVTAEDGETKKTYTVKATRASYTGCDILSFSVDGEEWVISGTNIIRAYPEGTEATSLTPVITLPPGATVNPPSGEAQNFFTDGGVAYTVTAEDGKTTKTYTAKATIGAYTGCDIVSFSVDGEEWDIDGTDITRAYPEGTAATNLTPVITLSPGATVNPPSGEAQNFFTDEGVAYTVTAEDGQTAKTYAAKATIDAGVTWKITGEPGNYTLTISGTGAMEDYGFPNNPPWYSYRNDIKTVVIEDGVKSIGNYAFSYCEKLTSVTIPNSVETIGVCSFQVCRELASVDIPNSVKTIGPSAFALCQNLTSATISNSITTIEDHTFENCYRLASVVIPNSVTSIGYRAFENCVELTSVTIGTSVETIGMSAFGNCRELTSLDIPNSVKTIGAGAFGRCENLTSVTIGNSVTTIEHDAFAGSGLTSVVIPNSVIYLAGFNANSKLTSVTIGNSVAEIDPGTFNDCGALTDINVDAGNAAYSSVNGVLYNKSQDALVECPEGKTGNFTVPNSVKTIVEYAFYRCEKLTSVTIPNSVTTIGKQAFTYCSELTGTLTIPNSVTAVGEHAFSGCTKLTGELAIPNSVKTVGSSAFSNCSGLTSVIIPNSITTVEQYVFFNCRGLTSVTIPNSVTNLGVESFSGCRGLTSITIPNSVTNIGWESFSGCSGLTDFTVNWTEAAKLPTLGTNIFRYLTPANITLHVPAGTTAMYEAAAVWKDFKIVEP